MTTAGETEASREEEALIFPSGTKSGHYYSPTVTVVSGLAQTTLRALRVEKVGAGVAKQSGAHPQSKAELHLCL